MIPKDPFRNQTLCQIPSMSFDQRNATTEDSPNYRKTKYHESQEGKDGIKIGTFLTKDILGNRVKSEDQRCM